MNLNQYSVKMDRLIEFAKNNPKDIAFMKQHMDEKDLQVFDQVVKESKYRRQCKKSSVKKYPFISSVITVMDEARLAAEFAVALAKSHDNKEIAIIDADRFDPKLDVYLNSKCYIKSVYTHLDVNRTTGLNLLIDAIHKNTLTPQYAKHLALRVHGLKNLHYFSGSYILDDYEYFKIDDFERTVSFLKANYDIVIISSNAFIYDGFTCHALMKSDVNLVPVSGHLTDVKEKVKLMDFLERKQQVSRSKNLYVLFDYNRKIHIDKKVIQSLIQGKTHVIPYSQYRNYGISKHYFLTQHMRRGQITMYNKLLRKILKDRL